MWLPLRQGSLFSSSPCARDLKVRSSELRRQLRWKVGRKGRILNGVGCQAEGRSAGAAAWGSSRGRGRRGAGPPGDLWFRILEAAKLSCCSPCPEASLGRKRRGLGYAAAWAPPHSRGRPCAASGSQASGRWSSAELRESGGR